MKDCTRLDVVTANLKKVSKKNNSKNTHNEYWTRLKNEMENDAWRASNSSLALNADDNGCSLDVSITYERKLRRYIKKIEFTSPHIEKKAPVEFTDTLISELTSLSSLASELAQKLSLTEQEDAPQIKSSQPDQQH